MRILASTALIVFAWFGLVGSQSASRIELLVAALRPALPYPAAAANGEAPANHDAQSPWFVVWPSTEGDTRVVVRANPLHPDTQKAGAEAMGRIQEAVVLAERKAQAAYDRALDELRRTGTTSDIDGISLDDEGIAGERIDAELELTINLQLDPQSWVVRTSRAPSVSAGTNGATWVVSIPANVYRQKTGADTREHFAPAETRLYFGVARRPEVSQAADETSFTVGVSPAPGAFVIVLRGNEQLLGQVLSTATWGALTEKGQNY